jgi:hypothetical protein
MIHNHHNQENSLIKINTYFQKCHDLIKNSSIFSKIYYTLSSNPKELVNEEYIHRHTKRFNKAIKEVEFMIDEKYRQSFIGVYRSLISEIVNIKENYIGQHYEEYCSKIKPILENLEIQLNSIELIMDQIKAFHKLFCTLFQKIQNKTGVQFMDKPEFFLGFCLSNPIEYADKMCQNINTALEIFHQQIK